MDPNLILCHSRINITLCSLVTARQFKDAGRDIGEQLSLVDSALVSLHEARSELTKYRETLYLEKKADEADEVPN